MYRVNFDPWREGGGETSEVKGMGVKTYEEIRQGSNANKKLTEELKTGTT